MDYKATFIRLALAKKALRFGEFKLKSGRISPYFFDSGHFNDATSLNTLGVCYATAVQQQGLDFDMLFGAAYKGIPIVSAMTIALLRRYNRSLPYCFNRKEEKTHGEGGMLLGAEPKGRVLIVDDVLSAGTSIKLSVDLLTSYQATPVGAIVALDRQEQGQHTLSAVEEIAQQCRIQVISLVTLDDILQYLQGDERLHQYHRQIDAYRASYHSDR